MLATLDSLLAICAPFPARLVRKSMKRTTFVGKAWGKQRYLAHVEQSPTQRYTLAKQLNIGLREDHGSLSTRSYIYIDCDGGDGNTHAAKPRSGEAVLLSQSFIAKHALFD